MIATSGIAFNDTEREKEGFEYWCGVLLKNDEIHLEYDDLKKFEHLRVLCNDLSGEGEGYYKRRSGNIYRDETSSLLGEFIERNYPVAIRLRPVGTNMTSTTDWTPQSLTREYEEEMVNVLIFDGDVNLSGDENAILQASVKFGEFARMSRGGFVSEDEDGVSSMKQPQIYLLLTSRNLEGNTAMNPNPSGDILRLLDVADSQFDITTPGGLETAWTNLRLGAGYDYPTHIDCYENVVTQFVGTKRIALS